MTWTVQAMALDDTEEMAGWAATIYAAAWATGVDQAATIPLRNAAYALGASGFQLMSRAQKWDRQSGMFNAVDELATDVRAHLRRVVRLTIQVNIALVAAYAALAAASAMPAKTEKQAAAKEAAIREAQERITDCQNALCILGELYDRLTAASHALDWLPDAFGEVYSGVLRTVASGITLPKDMDWFEGCTDAADLEGVDLGAYGIGLDEVA